jgi:plasmid stabilization system protein ParE
VVRRATPRIGDEFIADVPATIDRIGGTPESYPAWPRTRAAGPLIRKATTQRFPYVIAFEKHEEHVLVLAVAHAKH